MRSLDNNGDGGEAWVCLNYRGVPSYPFVVVGFIVPTFTMLLLIFLPVWSTFIFACLLARKRSRKSKKKQA